MWLLYLQSRDLTTPPSKLFGLTAGSYEAYCFDQAVWYFGTQVTHRVEKVGHKPYKGEATAKAAQERELKKILGDGDAKQQFADPAMLFGA